MRTFLILTTSVLALSVTAQEEAPTTVQASYDLLQETIIPELDLQKASFTESFKTIEKEWQKHYPDRTFPVALVEFKPALDPGSERLVTLNLKKVPFSEAIKYLVEASGMTADESSGLFKLKRTNAIIENWSTRVHPVNELILSKLGLNGKSSKEEVRAAYEKYGITLDDWMRISLAKDRVILMASDKHHSYVSALHHFLSSGFTLIPDTTPEIEPGTDKLGK